MNDRRGFLKLLGIGAGAAAAGVLAMVAGTPAPAPRPIQDIEAPKPYIGPDGVPKGDYIKERPPVIPDSVLIPKLIPDEYNWVVDGTKVITFDTTEAPDFFKPIEPGALIPTVDPTGTCTSNTYTTTGTYQHNLGGYVDSGDFEV